MRHWAKRGDAEKQKNAKTVVRLTSVKPFSEPLLARHQWNCVNLRTLWFSRRNSAQQYASDKIAVC